MGRIDVSDLLLDPDFIDPLEIVSRKPSLNLYGEQKLTEVCTQTVGSLQPISGKELQRLPDALRVANLMSFWVKAPITTGSDGKYTDIIVFKGKRYQINTVNDWSNWGEGWTEGTCMAEAITS